MLLLAIICIPVVMLVALAAVGRSRTQASPSRSQHTYIYRYIYYMFNIYIDSRERERERETSLFGDLCIVVLVTEERKILQSVSLMGCIGVGEVWFICRWVERERKKRRDEPKRKERDEIKKKKEILCGVSCHVNQVVPTEHPHNKIKFALSTSYRT